MSAINTRNQLRVKVDSHLGWVARARVQVTAEGSVFRARYGTLIRGELVDGALGKRTLAWFPKWKEFAGEKDSWRCLQLSKKEAPP